MELALHCTVALFAAVLYITTILYKQQHCTFVAVTILTVTTNNNPNYQLSNFKYIYYVSTNTNYHLTATSNDQHKLSMPNQVKFVSCDPENVCLMTSQVLYLHGLLLSLFSCTVSVYKLG